jgi:ATP-binding cassette subfamily B protein
MTALTRRAGVALLKGVLPNPKGRTVSTPEGAAAWIERASRLLGCEAEPVETTLASLEKDLRAVQPAILQMPDGTYLAILRGSGRSLVVVAPSLSLQRIGRDAVCRILREPAERSRRAQVERLLSDARIASRRRARASRAILRDQLGSIRFRQCWLIRIPPSAQAWQWFGQAHAARNTFCLIAAHATQYLLWLGAWWLMGQSALGGRIDPGMFLAWALLLITLIPIQLFTTWTQGALAIGVGGLLKERLLAGALRLHPEEVRHSGMGQFLGQVFEAEAVETLTLNGGIAALLSIVELAISAVILGRSAILLLIWGGAALLLEAQFLRRYKAWTETRREMTHDLVENMVGHRTRLVQQPRNEWHSAEDQTVEGYLSTSRSLDRSGVFLLSWIPRGWLLIGVAGLIPGFIRNSNSVAGAALQLGGVLLAYGALRRLSGSLADIAAAWVAWKQVAPLFHAAARPEAAGELLVSEVTCGENPDTAKGSRKVIQADRLAFRYREGNPVLQACSLDIAAGDRILLEGPSGGGKSTFASLLSGMRRPETGVLLAGGLDLHTLGLDRWRKQVATAPQFHENHVFTGTFCFNLLMGRSWPPTVADVEEAEGICRQLGLGDLLGNMPGGMLQMVGEGGWQLSHGERSRLYMARALLQGAELVILDESFAALDPENLGLAMQCAFRNARTLLVIAHP